MNLSYKQVLRVFFPPSVDEIILDAAATEIFTHGVMRRTNGIISLLPYHVPEVRAAIHLAKFHHHARARDLLGQTLAAFYRNVEVDLIIPIPLSKQRYRTRGYNQVVEILKAAQTYNKNLVYTEKILIRNRHTTAQTELQKSERLTNLTDAFSLVASAIPKNIHTLNIILLDDVVTTGATMKAAEAVLKKLGAKSITCVALAH